MKDLYLEKDKFVKIYSNEGLIKKFADGVPLKDIVETSNTLVYKMFPSTTEYKYMTIFGDSVNGKEKDIVGNEDGYYRVYTYALNPLQVFQLTPITKTFDDIVVENVYVFDDKYSHTVPTVFIYYVTNHGDFVYYMPTCSKTEWMSYEYLIPVEIFSEIMSELYKTASFYRGLYGGLPTDAINHLRNFDVTNYLVDLNYENISTPTLFEYYLGIGMGYSTYNELNDAVKLGGYSNIRSFEEDMKLRGLTTYEEYRTALDAMIAANAPPAETQPTPTPAPSKLWHLAWIIPVAILVPAAVIVPVTVIKKRKKKEE